MTHPRPPLGSAPPLAASQDLATALPLAARLAWRELRRGLRGFGVFLACLALGVGVVATVGILSAAVRHSLANDARAILGGDVEIRQSHLPLADEVLHFFRDHGDMATFVRMRVMARHPAEPSRHPVLVELKAVDNAYPLLGAFLTTSGQSLAQALAPASAADAAPVFGAVAERMLLTRLGIAVGDTITVGQATYRITDTIAREPDRAGNFVGLGPRLIVAKDSLDATGLMRLGSVIYFHYKLRLAQGWDAARFKTALKERFPDAGWRVRDVGDATPRLNRTLDDLSQYLTLVGLAALLVGGIGVANGVRRYLDGKTLSIATMKCLGAERSLVRTAYLVQILILAAMGSAIGIGAAMGAATLLTPLLESQLNAPIHVGFLAAPAATALASGLLTAFAFAVWPLSAAANVPPAQLFRGYADARPQRPTWRARISAACAVAATMALTLLAGGNPLVTLAFAAGTAACVAVFWAVALLVRRTAAALSHARNPRLRHALGNLHRPGAPTTGMLFSLGLGLTVLVAVTTVDGNMQARITQYIPTMAPTYFFIDVPPNRLDEFVQLVRGVPGVSALQYEPSLRGRIVRVNGVPADQVAIDPDVDWALRSDRGISFAAHPPQGTNVVAGSWWPPTYRGPPIICLDASIARGMNMKVGDTLTVNIMGREITARVACLRDIDWASLRLNHSIIFAPGLLEFAPHMMLATVHTQGGANQADDTLPQLVMRRFPETVVLYIKDILDAVSGLMRQIGAAVRAVAGVTLLAGLLVLAETVRANLRRRHHDAVVFKVLGATRADILAALAMEFAILGAVAALCAAALGTAVAWLFVRHVLDIPWTLRWQPVAVVVAGGMAATLALGLWGVRSALSRKAWPILRNE
ncbi:MAG: ABC transporter permease [Desulfovibrionaceae bacterium]